MVTELECGCFVPGESGPCEGVTLAARRPHLITRHLLLFAPKVTAVPLSPDVPVASGQQH